MKRIVKVEEKAQSFQLVGLRRLELRCLAAPASKTGVSTNFTTTPFVFRRLQLWFVSPRVELRNIDLPVRNPFVNSEAESDSLFVRLFGLTELISLQVASAPSFKLV